MPRFSAHRPQAPNADALREKMLAVWKEAQAEYRKAGEPFGSTSRALEVWMTYGRKTTAN
ncbi:hypothetical protein [Longibacter sp.]|uniref:hypothetical protein n=1 Tax=Longibacter sp. TaxID=2045415 RepID=UPI003EBB5521